MIDVKQLGLPVIRGPISRELIVHLGPDTIEIKFFWDNY